MSNLYPQLMANGNGNGGGSFDDYDTIIDEFSIGCESSDISSMHMSDMAEIIIAGVAAANTAETIATTTTIPHDALPKGGEAIMPPPTVVLDNANDDHHNNPDINDNHNDHGANNGYYYHVGDLYHVDSLGIDNTDMSAILGLASVSSSAASATTTSIGPSSSVDAESLLPIRNATRNHNGIEMEEDDQHSLPSVYAIKNDVAMRMTNNNSMNDMQDEMTNHNDDEEDGMNQSSCVSKQLGPLGDELSYASVEYQHHEGHGSYEAQNADYTSEYAADYLDEEEEDVTNHHRSILPNLITYSSRRSKCVTVFSTAFILGILVFAMVAVGVSYSSTGRINPFTSSSSSSSNTINGNPSIGGIGGGVEDGNNISGSIDSIRLPLESDDEENDVTTNNSSKQTTTTTTSRPTSSLTMSGTSTAEVASSTALPTTSPRDDEDDENPIQQQQHQMVALVPTTMPSEQPSHLRRPSTTPTLSSSPTTQPSMSNVPSFVPTISSQPSWPVGNDSVMEGDARFYLMADGGSNLRFADRLESLPMGQHKFVVHL